MVDYCYVPQGLQALSRAGRINAMAGHLGAAVVAGYLFGEDNTGLPDEVDVGVQGELDRIMRGEEAIWYNRKQADITIPELFEPFPEEEPQRDRIDTIAEALEANIAAMHQSGHNVIFASIALRALRDHPGNATPSVLTGISRLISLFQGATPGRGYFGKNKGWISGEQVQLPRATDFSPYSDIQAMIETTMDELIASASTRRQGFGGLHHLINHAAGLVELSLLGYKDLARKGLPAHHHHVRLLRHLPDVENEIGPVARARHDPRTPAYWNQEDLRRDTAMLTHRVKTLYGFFTLARFLQDQKKRAKAEERFLYLMA